MKWHPKNIRESMYPVLVLNWLTGSGLVDYPVGNLRNKLLSIPLLMFASFFWVASFYYEKEMCIVKQDHSLATKLYRVVRYLSTFTASSSVITGWYFRRRMQLITQNLKRIDEAFECLGLRKDYYYKSFKVITCKISVLIILMALYFIFNVNGRLASGFDFSKAVMCTSFGALPVFTCTMLSITFGISLNCFETRFTNINHLLRKGFCEYPKSYSSDEHEFFTIIKDFHFTNLDFTDLDRKKNVIELLKQIHLELCKLSREINQIYGAHLTCNMTIDFMSITSSAFNLLTYRGAFDTMKFKFLFFLLTFSALYLSQLLHNNITCSLTSFQAKKTREILLDMKLLRKNYKITTEIDRFHQQIILRPLAFTTCGFRTLGVNFIFSFLGTIVTYLLVFIQMDNDNKAKGKAA